MTSMWFIRIGIVIENDIHRSVMTVHLLPSPRRTHQACQAQIRHAKLREEEEKIKEDDSARLALLRIHCWLLFETRNRGRESINWPYILLHLRTCATENDPHEDVAVRLENLEGDRLRGSCCWAVVRHPFDR